MYFRRLECTGCEYGGLYHLETYDSKVACVSFTSLRDLHRQFGYPTLQVLKKLVPELGQMSSLECE